MALDKLAYMRRVAQFVGVRFGQYIELAMIETSLYKAAIVRTVVAYVAMAFCAVFALAFLSIAVLVTFWDTDSRIQAAWWIFGTWAALAIVALIVGAKAAPSDAPASTLGHQLKKDLAAIRGENDE